MILAGLVGALIREDRIRTTETKAKRARPLADKMITLGKAGNLHARRRALAVIEDRDIIHKLFDEVAPRFADRNGGYTRILKLGPRKGDAAPMAILEFVEGEAPAKAASSEEQTKRRRVLGRRKKTEDSLPKAAQASEEGDVPEPQADDSSEAPDQSAGSTPSASNLTGQAASEPSQGTSLPPESAEGPTTAEAEASAQSPDESQGK